MKSLVLGLTLVGAISAANAIPAVTPIFIPTAIFYHNGKLIKLLQVGEPYTDMQKCLKEMQEGIQGMIESGKIPNGGSVVGACVPVPSTVAPMAAT